MMVGAVALILASCGKKQGPQQAQGPAVLPVVEVPTRVVTSYQEFPASIEGINNNEVRAKIQGYIQQVYVDEGQYVTKGQPLFRLETNVLTQNADAAKAGITSAAANVKAAAANVSAAAASVSVAQVEVNKLIPLVQKNIISNVQLETAKANLAQAQAAHNQAKAGLAQAQAGQSQAQANYQGVAANIDFSIVRSPINGVVGALPFKTGSLVGPSDPVALTRVSDVSKVFAYFSMNEKEYMDFLTKSEGTTLQQKLSNLPPVELVLANGELYPEKGQVQTVTGQVDPATGSIQFRVSFPNASKLLSNGASGKVRVPKVYVDAIVVPEGATFEQQGYTYVYKVEKDTARQTVIQVVDRASNMAIITDGLKKGDKVVAQGVAKLRDKTPVSSQPANFDTIIKIKQVF